MSKQTDDLNNLINEADTYDDEQLEFIDVDAEPKEEFKASEPEPEENLITDAGEGTAFAADWDKIEKNYQEKHFGSSHSHSHHHSSGEHRHHHSSGEHRSSHSSSGEHHSSHGSDGEHRHHSSSHHSGGSHSSSGEHRHHSSHGSHHSSRRHSSSKKKDKKERKKWSTRKKVIVGIILFFLCIIIGIGAAFFIMRWQGKNQLTDYDQLNLNLPDWVNYKDGGYIIYYKGHEYTFNDNIATILFMGIDNRKLKTNAKMGTAGQADALYLMTYDVNTKKMRVLCINRDTMTDISRYDEAGNYIDTKNTQICLAYAFGDGKKTSAENEKTAVQRLMYNIPVNAYYAIDLSAIKILNDDIGGVPVVPQYTFKMFKKGVPITLRGNQAETFVRHRDIKKVDDNLRRIECQKTYINGFVKQVVPATTKNLNTPRKLYDHSKKYTVSNITAPELVYLATDLSFGFNGYEMIGTQGKYKMVKGDASAEYYIKEKPFFETLLNIFYIQTG
ncbi:MAG: LCP family protein [Eubacterium sp.]|nr:LCP family protein [Eubacterium sp.]